MCILFKSGFSNEDRFKNLVCFSQNYLQSQDSLLTFISLASRLLPVAELNGSGIIIPSKGKDLS